METRFYPMVDFTRTCVVMEIRGELLTSGYFANTFRIDEAVPKFGESQDYPGKMVLPAMARPDYAEALEIAISMAEYERDRLTSMLKRIKKNLDELEGELEAQRRA